MLTRKTIALFVDGATCTEVPPESGKCTTENDGRAHGRRGRPDR
jgi:hypothetical protein